MPSAVFSCEMSLMIEPVERPRPESHADFESPPRLYVYGDVLDEIRFNGRWRGDGLAGGLLMGRHYRDPDDGGQYAVAEGFVGGTHCDDLTALTRAIRGNWKTAIAERGAHLPESEIVGWYVAPAGDLAPDRAALLLHNTFFNHPWQVGLWVAPKGRPVAVQPAGDTLDEGVVALLDRAGARLVPTSR